MRAGDVLGRVLLVTGKEEFLNQRAIDAAREVVVAHDPETEVADAPAADLSAATLGELTAPSLFSSTRFVVVRALEHLTDDAAPGLLDYAAVPAEDVALVLVHGGGPKGSGHLTKLRKLKTVTEQKSEELKASEYPGFVTSEVRRHGAAIDNDAARVLVDSVGQDLRSLAAAAHQLTNDFPGEKLTTEKVSRYFGGRAEAKSFVVADHAFSGRREQALEELRWALDNGTAAVLITSAFATSARGLARYRGAARGVREADLARAVGVPPWKLKTLRGQVQSWTDSGLSRAVRAVAQADADVKGAASDAAYALERLVLTVAALRD